jgi:hypothetical protein
MCSINVVKSDTCTCMRELPENPFLLKLYCSSVYLPQKYTTINVIQHLANGITNGNIHVNEYISDKMVW